MNRTKCPNCHETTRTLFDMSKPYDRDEKSFDVVCEYCYHKFTYYLEEYPYIDEIVQNHRAICIYISIVAFILSILVIFVV